MPLEPDEFGVLLAEARTGNADAVARLAAEYEHDVRLVARVLLGPALRPYLDSLDLVQSVHRSLMIGLREEKFDIASAEKLVAITVEMVRRKVGRHWRKLKRQQRLDDDVPGLPPLLATLESSQPDPAAHAQFRDAVEHLYAQLGGTERSIMEMRLEGQSTAEIARQLGLDADVLRVNLSRLRQRLRAAGALSEWL